MNTARRYTKTVSLNGDLAEIEALLDGTDSPEAQMEASQRSERILSALNKLSPRQRAVIVQRYYLEMSEQEISVRLQAAPGTVKWHLHVARARLRDLLRPERSNQ